MALSVGTRPGSYEIVAPLGAGGMGEVYRARDRKLGRDIAIKVLPAAFASDPDRLARFQREAQALASLNHPNIASIHDIQEDRGIRFLVLELVEGETLAARVKRGPLPIDEALELLKQVAEALEAAHEKGILHRDLKPANIQITPEGRAKVLDFGLAKMTQSEGAPDDPANSPTLSHGVTARGVILGTAAYMSPEQARGRIVDKRTDVWAFGCVLYETLTGERAFGGETVTDILASLVKGEPDWSLLPIGTPAAARSLLRQCLHKQPRHRLQEIADARIAIEDAVTEPAATEPRAIPAVSSWRWLVPGFTAVLIIGVMIGWLAKRAPSEAPAVTRLQMGLQPADQLNGIVGFGGSIGFARPSRTAFALSPDGQWIVFRAIRLFNANRGTTPSQYELYLLLLCQIA